MTRAQTVIEPCRWSSSKSPKHCGKGAVGFQISQETAGINIRLPACTPASTCPLWQSIFNSTIRNIWLKCKSDYAILLHKRYQLFSNPCRVKAEEGLWGQHDLPCCYFSDPVSPSAPSPINCTLPTVISWCFYNPHTCSDLRTYVHPVSSTRNAVFQIFAGFALSL